MPGEDTDQGSGIIDSKGNISVYQVICDALGCDVPPGADENKCILALYKHAMSQVKERGLQMSDTMNQPNQGTNDLAPNYGTGATVQESQPLYMSLEQINAIPDPNVRNTAAVAHAILQGRLAEYGSQRQTRIGELAKRVPQTAREMLLSLAKVPYNLKSDGTISDPAEITLSLMEKTAPQVVQDLTRQGASFAVKGVEQQQPHFDDIALSEERADAVFNEFAGNTGLLTAEERRAQSTTADPKAIKLAEAILAMRT
jgi:hypothetical protein